MKYSNIFEKLWSDYINLNPHAKLIYELFVSESENIVNDHIAFRTFNDKRVNINVLAKIFIDNAYFNVFNYIFTQLI